MARQRIVVAMSGGVDSSAVAGMLAGQGHEVIGVTLQLYDHGAAVGRKGACCAGQDIHDARVVADRLGIPHYVLDIEARFRSAVIADFADSYARGETPVPCVRCNQTVKFSDLLEFARDLGADALATGHYARRVEGTDGPELWQAADPARDQSYFLFATTRDQLSFCCFPLGEMPDKAAVRAEAARLGLPVADKPDSQDICFVPTGRYDSVVARLRPEAAEPGEIATADGTVIGSHAGIGRFTVGQARGLGDASQHGGERMHVLALDPARRRVVVGPRAALGRRRIALRGLNWLCVPPIEPRRVSARLRHRAVPVAATIHPDGMLDLDEPAVASPGQAAVLYDGARLLGGGFIRPGVDAEGDPAVSPAA